LSFKEQIIRIFGNGSGADDLDKYEAAHTNPNYDEFADLDDSEAKLEYSVVEKHANRNNHDDGNIYGGGESSTINGYRKLVYGDLSRDKIKRLQFYREMASYPEVSEALDEIADACANPKEDGSILDLCFTNSSAKLAPDKKTTIKESFDDLMSLFNFEEDGFEFFRNFLIDGELTWENIISDKDYEKKDGIVAIARLPNECYEYLIDDRYKQCGIVVNGKMVPDRGDVTLSSGHDIRQSVAYTSNVGFEKVNLKYSNYERVNEDDGTAIIPMPMTQVTHVNSGIFNSQHTVALPVLEKARKPYRQLSLLEDAIIIYRLVRAPERLVFNVPTGKLNMHKAEQVVYNAMKRYQSKQVVDPGKGSIVNDYDPHQMLDSYWFSKPDGSDGTSVTTLQTGQNLGQLDDLVYFQKKLYVALKVPYNRHGFAEDNKSEIQNGESITYDEYRFSKFIIRIQQRFSKGLFSTFKTHLKLTGLWERFNLNDRMFKIKFNAPSAYTIYEEQRLMRARVEGYKIMTEHEEMSKRISMSKYLGMTDEEIDENYKMLEKEVLTMAYIERKRDNIAAHGNPEDDFQDVQDIDAIDVESAEEDEGEF
jgi:hypothetical protein